MVLSFGSSYSGAIITCIVLYITIKLNNRQIRASIKEVEIRAKIKEKLEIAEYAYKTIPLMN